MPLSQDKFKTAYTEYLESVQTIRDKSEAKAFTTLKLTDKERQALDDAPPWLYEQLAETLGKYEPSSPDGREEMVLKFLGAWLVDVAPLISDAVRIGYDFGKAIE